MSPSAQPSITPIILCGGSGTRLWPLSRQSFPKQFVPLIGNKSLLQLSLERTALFNTAPVLIGAEAHRYMMLDVLGTVYSSSQQINAHNTHDSLATLILEPFARNTAAAMALGALQGMKEKNSTQHASRQSPQEIDSQADQRKNLQTALKTNKSSATQSLLLFCPADHHIPDQKLFHDTVMKGADAALSGSIVTFGVQPSFPSTAYGYIQASDESSKDVFKVERFIEKPDSVKAQKLILEGGFYWNAGIFLCTAETLIAALQQFAPDILSSCEQALADANTHLTREPNAQPIKTINPKAAALKPCRSESIDYAVMEHATNVALVKFEGQWSDVGSWNAVANLTPADDSGNRIEGQGFTHLSQNTFIHAPTRPVVALGTHDLLIIDTPDAVLVAAQSHAEQVKDVVAQLQQRNKSQAVTHRKVARPWGWYDSIDMGERFQVKRIGVKPGAALSLQKHHHRAEHWVVVRGTAEVTRGTETFMLCENQSTYIPIGEVHRLKNPGVVELEMIEIQSGSYLGEDDIVRFEDVYGRVKNSL